MYEVINIFTRHTAKTAFFDDASPANRALNDAYAVAEAAADGYRGRMDEQSKSGRRFTVTILWRDKDAADRFATQAGLTFADFLAQRDAYYAANRIRYQVLFDSVPDVAPPAP